jgi:galactokinase
MTKFFCPGRTELAGNHTDHQKGRAMAAAVDTGIFAEAEPNGTNSINVFSDGFEPFRVDLDKLWPDESEIGTPAALVKGVSATLAESAEALNGFDAYVVSHIPVGRGMSSSAAFSVLIGCIIGEFAEGAFFAPEEIAKAACKAENRWFGKPCGLLDQMACAMGGAIYIDFLHSKIIRMDCNFDSLGLALCLTDTGGSHAAALKEYARIPADMSEVAQTFGVQWLGKVRPSDFEEEWPKHKQDLKWMRARHFFDESLRAASMADALGLRDGRRYMELMNESGRSSETLLRNITAPGVGDELAKGLAIAARMLDGVGAWRVHGGGFAGCVQALMPQDLFEPYEACMDDCFGPGACQRIKITPKGAGKTT